MIITDNLRLWAIVLCVASVVSGFMFCILPKSSLQKAVRIIISLFMLGIVISPFSGKASFDIDIPDIDFNGKLTDEDYSLNLDSYIISQGEKSAEETIKNCLVGILKDDFTVKVNMFINSDGNPEISDIVVMVSEKEYEKSQKIKSVVSGQTGIVPEVSARSDK